MKKRSINNVKLGLFVVAGLLFLIVMLYMIGRDQNLFSRNMVLRARFTNASGLVAGNNVRYAGIQVGTVKKVKLVNDTTVEVVMLVDQQYRNNIHKNALASITTEGLIGNRIVSIIPGKGDAAIVDDGDLIAVKKIVTTDELLETLSQSNRNIAAITDGLKATVERINNSTALWKLLNDESLPGNLKLAARNIRQATEKANGFVGELEGLVTDVKAGKGSLGAIITDTALAVELNKALLKFREVGEEANQLGAVLNSLGKTVKADIDSGQGPAHAILKDTLLVSRLNASLANIQNGTAAFNANMEALKHNFLFRGYFRKLEKQQKKAAAGQ